MAETTAAIDMIGCDFVIGLYVVAEWVERSLTWRDRRFGDEDVKSCGSALRSCAVLPWQVDLELDVAERRRSIQIADVARAKSMTRIPIGMASVMAAQRLSLPCVFGNPTVLRVGLRCFRYVPMTPNSAMVLVVEPQQEAAMGLARSLAAHGYAVEIRSGAREVRDLVERRRFSALILSARLPDGDGFALCRRLRRASEAAILVLTAGGDDLDRIVGLDSGADDCLERPIVHRELIARLRGILRRRAAAAAREPILEFGPLQIDCRGRVVRLNGVEKPLSSLQFALLVAFAENAGRVLRREELHDILAGGDPAAFGRSIDVQVCRLRSQIEDDASCPRRLVTVRGTGYLFDAGVDARI